MDVQEVIAQARDAITVKRVFGDPYEKNGVTVIPAARVGGGGGGGGGEGEGPGGEGSGKGSGSGFGIAARPAGVYVIRGDDVRWQPAIDVNKIILGAQLVAIAALLTLRALFKARAKAQAVEALAGR
jgi:uncharacterized spore protein YtfJ